MLFILPISQNRRGAPVNLTNIERGTRFQKMENYWFSCTFRQLANSQLVVHFSWLMDLMFKCSCTRFKYLSFYSSLKLPWKFLLSSLKPASPGPPIQQQGKGGDRQGLSLTAAFLPFPLLINGKGGEGKEEQIVAGSTVAWKQYWVEAAIVSS